MAAIGNAGRQLCPLGLTQHNARTLFAIEAEGIFFSSLTTQTIAFVCILRWSGRCRNRGLQYPIWESFRWQPIGSGSASLFDSDPFLTDARELVVNDQELFRMDWRCSTAGMSVIDAERVGLRTADRTGLMAFDGSAETPQSVSCRIISDIETGRVVGATVYGPDSHRLMEPLRRAIVEGENCEDLFHVSEEIANADDVQKKKRLKAR